MKTRLLLIGWYANREIEQAFRNGAASYCPNIIVAHRDGRKQANVEKAWQVADAFTLLADNVQETFGLAPIEAMAAGLPSVVTDWNGFRDTIRHGVDGFRVPTLMPGPGAGVELIRRHFDDEDDYDQYIGKFSQAVAVDEHMSCEAYSRLLADERLRKCMGDAAQERALEQFDWQLIVRRYEELFRELNQRRRSMPETAAANDGGCPHPLRDDPFSVFRGYATRSLSSETILAAADVPPASCEQVFCDPLCNLGLDTRRIASEVWAVLEVLSEPQTADTLTEGPLSHPSKSEAWRMLAWMTKVGLVVAREKRSSLCSSDMQDGIRPVSRVPTSSNNHRDGLSVDAEELS